MAFSQRHFVFCFGHGKRIVLRKMRLSSQGKMLYRLSDFGNRRTAIRKVFKEFNRFCYKQGLFSHEGISIDGSKFNAVNAKDNNFTQSKLDDRLERIDGHIKEYLSELDAADLDDRQAEEIGKKLSGYRERKEKYENIQKRMTDENVCQISLTDSESKLMKMNEGFGVCYNTQTAVDTGSHLIADFEVTDSATEFKDSVP